MRCAPGSRGWRALAVCLGLGLGSACMSSNPLDARLQELGDVMRTGLDVHEPSAHFTRREERETLFRGSYDWHSCVIAHWALLVKARMEQDAVASADLCVRTPVEGLSEEFEGLEGRSPRSRGTVPYDEAWFCVFLAERLRHEEDPSARETLLRLRLRAEARLLRWLEEHPFPEGIPSVEQGGTGYCGFYRSWLWAWLLLEWSNPVDARVRARLEGLAQERVEPARIEVESLAAAHPYDFLSVPAVLALADRARGLTPSYEPPPFAGWPAEVSLRDVHVLGLELCRVWPAAAAEDRGPRGVFRDRVASLMKREELWRGDFAVVSHWVPQYLFIGWWLAAGQP